MHLKHFENPMVRAPFQPLNPSSFYFLYPKDLIGKERFVGTECSLNQMYSKIESGMKMFPILRKLLLVVA